MARLRFGLLVELARQAEAVVSLASAYAALRKRTTAHFGMQAKTSRFGYRPHRHYVECKVSGAGNIYTHGKLVGAGSELRLGDIGRVTHGLYAEVVASHGGRLLSSSAVRFTLYQHSIFLP